jgi:hypothetical protein
VPRARGKKGLVRGKRLEGLRGRKVELPETVGGCTCTEYSVRFYLLEIPTYFK